MSAVLEWVTLLSDLVQHQAGDPPTPEKLATYACMLELDGLPPQAYCEASLHAVAREMQWWAAYSVVSQHLSKWWRETHPVTSLALPKPDAPTPADRLAEYAAAWQDAEWVQQKIHEARSMPSDHLGPALTKLIRSALASHAPQNLHLLELH